MAVKKVEQSVELTVKKMVGLMVALKAVETAQQTEGCKAEKLAKLRDMI